MAGSTKALRAGLVAGGVLLALGLGGFPAALAAQIVGTNGDDVLNGTAADDVINGLEGADVIHGRAGADRLNDGPGDDLVFGDRGADTLVSINTQALNADHDVLRGGFGPDVVLGLDGDTALGGPQNDDVEVFSNGGRIVARGGPGADTIRADGSALATGPVRAFGGPGADSLRLDSGSLIGAGGRGDDKITIQLAVRASGGSGDDAIALTHVVERDTGPGEVRAISGGRGDDVIQTWPGTIATDVSCGPGTDTVLVSPTQHWGADCETHFFFFEGDECDGCNEDEHIVGTTDNDWIDAKSGADQIEALAGDDRIFPGSGSDIVAAGPGNDVIVASGDGAPTDSDTVRCGSGFDTVTADANDVIAADCEVVRGR